MSKIEKKLQSQSMSIAQQLMPIYNTTVHKNKSTVALNVDTNMPQGPAYLYMDAVASMMKTVCIFGWTHELVTISQLYKWISREVKR